MMNFRSSEKIQVFTIFFLLTVIAFLSLHIPKVAFLTGLGIFVWGMYMTVTTRNQNDIALLVAGFIMGAEVFFRMTWSGLPWEFGKYAIIFLLTTAMLLDNKKRKTSLSIIAYIVLLLPAVYLTFDFYHTFKEAKDAFLYNMLGPISLFVSVLYFYQLDLVEKEFKLLSRWIVFGVFLMAMFVFMRVGNYAAISFGGGSNLFSSGGFSGNQVSVGFGIGVLFISLNLILKQTIFYYKVIDIALLILFIFQGLMTFSRGGMMTTLVGLVLGSLVYYFSNFQQFIDFITKKFLLIAVAFILGTGVFMYVDDLTGGALYTRYFNKKADGTVSKKDPTTGRGEIALGDLELFERTDFVGVGIGVSKIVRPTHKNYAAHTEFSRMLAEHGFLGVFAMIIMFCLPFKQFFNVINDPSKLLILTSMSSWALATMTHAATRQSAVGFIYGLAFILLIPTLNKKEKK